MYIIKRKSAACASHIVYLVQTASIILTGVRVKKASNLLTKAITDPVCFCIHPGSTAIGL